MLKHRLVFGTLMTLLFTAIVIFDGWVDGTLTASAADDKPVRATILCILIASLVGLAQLELSKLAAQKNLRIFLDVCIGSNLIFNHASLKYPDKQGKRDPGRCCCCRTKP